MLLGNDYNYYMNQFSDKNFLYQLALGPFYQMQNQQNESYYRQNQNNENYNNNYYINEQIYYNNNYNEYK